MQELDRARKKDNYLEYLEGKLALDLLVIDDFGLNEFDLDKCRDLFEVIDGRDGRKSTVIVSQFPVKEWYDLFADMTYAEACLSRIPDHGQETLLPVGNEWPQHAGLVLLPSK